MSMYEYIKKMLGELPLDMKGAAKTPAANHFITGSNNLKKLTGEEAQLFHHLVTNYYTYAIVPDKTFIMQWCTCAQG